MKRYYITALALIGVTSLAHGADISRQHQPFLLAEGFGDFFGQLTQSFTNAAINKASQEANEAAIGAINNAPPTASGVRYVAPANPEVREIQQRLTQLGYSPGPADGIMGQKTRLAIYSYQQSLGLPADGMPSGQLLSTLRSQTGYANQVPRTLPAAQVATETPPKQFWTTVSGDTTTPLPAPEPAPRLLTDQEIASVQQYLTDMGYDPGRADGTVDKRTESAIYAYQREFGLPADGRPSLKVLMSLRANAVSPEQSNQGPQLEPIKVTLAPDMMRSEKTLFYECERELNVRRRQEGIAEIKLITAKEAAEAAQAANAELVAKVGQDMIGGMYQPTEVRIANKLAELGSVNAAIANMQNNVVAQQSAVSALTACASGKKLAKK